MNLINVSIITGFLGVGKTTLIKRLIQCKPSAENWAVIVNEFGEIGVDALLLEDPSVTIKQVPGGCACCTAQLPFQLALNQLLKSKELHRIFIEPSGLGHADKLADVLNQSQYENWLSLKSVVTLIDPVQFSNTKYRNHDIYQRQLSAANGYLVSKRSQASEQDVEAVYKYVASKGSPVMNTEAEPKVLLDWLDSSVMKLSEGNNHQVNGTEYSGTLFSKFKKVPEQPSESLESGFSKVSVQPDLTDMFNVSCLQSFIERNAFTRLKGLVNTSKGMMSMNCALSHVSIEPYEHKVEQCIIEIIHHERIDESEIKQALKQCIE
jgi:G3E family GTPase